MRNILLMGIVVSLCACVELPATTWYVDGSVAGPGNGQSWQTAFKTIQQGIDASSDGDTVIVAQGTYVENTQFKGKNIVLTSTDPLNPTVVTNTMIDGNQSGPVVAFWGSESNACVLCGFTIQNGRAQFGGGISSGLMTGWSARPTIQNNIIKGKAALTNGGGIARCDGTIQNNLIAGNSATEDGGGAYFCDGNIQNNTITGNSSGWGGGLSMCMGTIRNCIIWGNTSPFGYQVAGGVHLSYCCIQDLTDSGVGNISSDPLFFDPAGGDYRLRAGSPCIDAGASYYSLVWPQRDLDGNCRLKGHGTDMGCYEYDASPDGDGDLLSDAQELALGTNPHREDTDGDGLRDGLEALRGSDPTTPTVPGTVRVPSDVPSIQGSLCLAINGDEIIVSPGTYVETINFGGSNVILRSTDLRDPAVVAATIIDAKHLGSVVTFSGSEDAGCGLSGFTIRNGSDDATGGGAIYGAHTRAWIANNRIVANQGSMDGGGLFHCDGLISNNVIVGNATFAGGGLAYCDGTIENNIIVGNSASMVGGGLFWCQGTVRNNKIIGNLGFGEGGAVFGSEGVIQGNLIAGNTSVEGPAGLSRCDGTLRDNLIVGNSTDGVGGGVGDSKGRMLNNTISSNWAGVAGGGIWKCSGTISNCIIWGNGAPLGPQVHECASPAFSCIEGWEDPRGGNITDDPLFAGAPLSAGHWSSDGIFDDETWQTVLVDSSASWPPGALKDLLVNPNTSQHLQFLIASNTATTLKVWGNASELAKANQQYEVCDYRLLSTSPCIDAGDNAVDAGMLDLDGGFRRVYTKTRPGWSGKVDYIVREHDGSVTLIWKGSIDIGAYECQVFGEVPETFAVETTESIVLGDWIEVFSGKVCAWSDDDTSGGAKFYRVHMK